MYSNGGSNPSNSEKVGKTQTNIDNSDMSNTKKLTEEPERILDIVGMETGSFPLQQDTSGKLIPGFKIASTDSLNKISYSAPGVIKDYYPSYQMTENCYPPLYALESEKTKITDSQGVESNQTITILNTFNILLTKYDMSSKI